MLDNNISDPGGLCAQQSSTRSLTAEGLNEINAQIIAAVRQGLIVYDKELKHSWWNPFMEEMAGLRTEEIVGKRDSELFSFVKKEGLDVLLEQALAGESVCCPEFAYFIPQSGLAGWASARYEPLRNSRREVVGVVAIVQDITKLKLAQQALTQSEERYRTVIERAVDVIYMVSPDYAILSLNESFESITGWQRADWIGKSFLNLLHPADIPTAVAIFQQVLRGETVPPFELRFGLESGACFVGECTAVPQSENGRVVSATGIVRDVTARNRADEALRASNERFELIVRATNDAVWDWNLVTGAIWWSEGLETLFGYHACDAATEGARWHDQIHPDDRERVISGLQRVLEPGGQSWFDEYRYQRSNGSYAHVFDRGFVLRSEDGTAVRMIGAMMDTTDRRSVEDALQRAEEKYRSIFENAVEGIFQSTPEGNFITVNPTLVRMLGYDSAEDLMESFNESKNQLYTDPNHRSEFKRLLEEQGTVQRFENQVYRKDRSVMWISESARTVRNAAGEVLYYEGTVEDITGLKQAEAERRHLEEQLLQAQRIESLGLLAGGIAHDFNNLLTAIIGYAQLVDTRLGLGHPLNGEVKQIIDAGQRAATLTGQLLAFSRRQTLIRRPVNLNDTLSNLMNMLRRIIGGDVEIRFREAPEPYLVLADAVQIEQVIMNLAVNARDAMPDGGQLLIETRNITLDEAYCREHAWARPGKYTQIAVSDSGMGMDSEIQRRIFEPFFSTKQIGKGTGLGLAVVYGIVKQHEGLVHVYSEPGQGATFRIYLRAYEFPVGDEFEEPLGPTIRGGNETVLVAEDELTLRKLAKSLLEGLGYRVLLAADGEEAVNVYEQSSDQIDLVILDLIMPRMGGREAYERICRIGNRECPVIFVTGYAPEILKSQLAESKVAELIEKPYELDVLARRVRDVLDAIVSSRDK